MTASAPDRPHLWVSYPYGPGEAEICTLCGEFQTPATAEAECPETLTDDMPAIPPDMAGLAWPDSLDPPDGTDDEQRQGAIIPP